MLVMPHCACRRSPERQRQEQRSTARASSSSPEPGSIGRIVTAPRSTCCELKVKSACLDGELCALNTEGVPVFAAAPPAGQVV